MSWQVATACKKDAAETHTLHMYFHTRLSPFHKYEKKRLHSFFFSKLYKADSPARLWRKGSSYEAATRTSPLAVSGIINDKWLAASVHYGSVEHHSRAKPLSSDVDAHKTHGIKRYLCGLLHIEAYFVNGRQLLITRSVFRSDSLDNRTGITSE